MVTNETKPYWRDPLIAFSRMSGWILGPILLGLVVGKWLDAKFGTAPLLFALCMGFSFLGSTFGIVKESKQYLKKVVTESEKKSDGE